MTHATAEASLVAIRADEEMTAVDGWSRMSIISRARIIDSIRDRILQEQGALAELEAKQSGKFLKNALQEVRACADLWTFAADLLRDEARSANVTVRLQSGLSGVISPRPLGPVLMITPYNYPLIVLSERLPFALAAGCSVVVKPSEFTPASTVLLSEIANDAGLPNRAFQVAVGGSDLGAALTSNPLFRLVSFTGSTKTAATVASLIDHRRVRTSFELGGKNSFIVFPDADIEAAVESAAYATTVNGGQACIAPSRIIIHSEIAEEFQHRLGQAYAQIVSENLKEFGVPIQQPPTEQFAARARKLLKTIESAGWSLNDDWTSSTSTAQLADWIRPHIFHVEHVDHPLFSEEFFVPYVTISCFSDMDQAVELANIGELGLAAYFWSSSRETFNELHARVRAGRQWWNCDMRSFSPKLPIGGLELSGIGRELGMAALDYYRLPVAATIQSL